MDLRLTGARDALTSKNNWAGYIMANYEKNLIRLILPKLINQVLKGISYLSQ